MNQYIVEMMEKDAGESEFWRCGADDKDHAIEQAKDFYDSMGRYDVVAVYREEV